MLFSTKYLVAFVGEEPEAGLVKMDEHKECENCGDRTDFMDIGMLIYLCQDSCRKRMMRKYLEVANEE